MTNDQKIDKIYDIVIKLEPMVKEHRKTLYGNGKIGVVEVLSLLSERQNECPARKSISTENKKLKLAYVMMIVAVLSALASVVMGIVNLIK